MNHYTTYFVCQNQDISPVISEDEITYFQDDKYPTSTSFWLQVEKKGIHNLYFIYYYYTLPEIHNYWN